MNINKPRVSIGMPVFNGENYLAEALDSLLSQTYSDFELIISDNASTDSTQEICQTYAVRDHRIRYFCNKTNVGAAYNYNRVFELSLGEYFKWAAHDDLCAPEYIERCVEVLDREPSVVVCHSKTIYIDENGEEYAVYDDRLDLRSPKPHIRYRDYFFRPYNRCNAVFGVIRMSKLKKTPLIGSYHESDRVLLGELALRGKIYRVPEHLFFRRDHPQQLWNKNPSRQMIERWYNPFKIKRISFPHWKLFLEHFKSINRVRMTLYERTWCYLFLVWWVRRHWRHLSTNLILKKPRKRTLSYTTNISMSSKALFRRKYKMNINKPRVSIGMPVFNGEKYIAKALDSLLSQTYSDFELIISDNASTDSTQEICQTYASRDNRIRYFRNKTNLGAAYNFNRVFELSTGEYFKWAAYDDICAPEYLERCIEVLDREPSVVVCHTKTIYIDKNGEEYLYRNIEEYDDYLDLQFPEPHKRFNKYLFRPSDRWNAIFGLIRKHVLNKTPLIGPYPLSDRILLGELILLGKVYRVQKHLFFRRDHLQTAMRANPSDRAYAVWFDPVNRKKLVLPRRLRALFEYLLAIKRVRLSWYEASRCYLYMIKWGCKHLILGAFKRSSYRAYRLLTSFDKQKTLVKRLIRKG